MTEKRSFSLLTDRLGELKCNPVESMAKIADKAMEDQNYDLAFKVYRELAQYTNPKRRPVDVQDKFNPEYRTPEEREEIRKQNLRAEGLVDFF